MNIDMYIYVDDEGDEDIVVDFNDIMPAKFLDNVIWEVDTDNYDEEEGLPIYELVAQYDKIENTLTIKRTYYNELLSRGYDFDTLLIRYMPYDYLNGKYSGVDMCIHLIILNEDNID